MTKCAQWMIIVVIASSANVFAQELPSDGTPTNFVMEGGDENTVTVRPGVWVQVPAGSEQIRISMTGEAGSDVDFLVRFGDEFDLSGGLQDVLDEADYYSIGPDHEEYVTITRASNPALAPGRWYVLPVNWEEDDVEVTMNAIASFSAELDPPELRPVYDSQEEADGTGFFDPTPYTSPSNPATTLGEARRIAFERAMEIAQDALRDAGVYSPVPVMIGARFEDLGGFDEDDNGLVTAAQAGPGRFAWNFPGALEPDTVYPGPLVAKQAGTDLCRALSLPDCNEADVQATFNANEDIEWSYALESVPHRADFISTAMHEVMHGLGFLSAFALEDDDEGSHPVEAGEWLAPFPDIYSRNLVHVSGGSETPLAEMGNAGRMEAATSVDGLRWSGEIVAQSPGNQFAGQGELFAMYAPAEIRLGSSVSHVNNQQPVAASELMRPSSGTFSPRHIGLTAAFMLDMGWGGGAAADEHPIHFGMSGVWHNPATSGQGILFDVVATQDPPQVAGFWFTFADNAGGPESQRWYTAQGDYTEGDSSVELTVYVTTGGEFDRRPPAPETIPVGSMTLAFQSCTEATLDYDFNIDNNPSRRTRGTVPLTRVSPDIACGQSLEIPGGPEAPITPPRPFRINYGLNGLWRERATSGQGLLFDVVETQDPPQVVALWFTFSEEAGGSEGQRWFIAQGDYSPGDRSVTLDVRMSLGGEFDRRPPVPELVDVGEAVLEFGTGLSSCTQATLSYEIILDGDFAQARSGEIALERVAPDILCRSFFDR